MSKMLPNMERMSDEDLGQMFRNCIKATLLNKPNRKEAEDRMAAINEVLRSRSPARDSKTPKEERPEKGLLKTIGYHVGSSGLNAEERRELLDYAMQGVLPFVQSVSYMNEWGEPSSSTRYRKLHRVLASFRTTASNQPNQATAFKEWGDDIAYIEHKWKNSTTVT